MTISPVPDAASFSAPPPVRGTTRVVGVLGWPVRHSASPPMHNAAFRALSLPFVYVPFAVAPNDLGAALAGVRALGLAGVNVTVPLKEQVAPHLDAVSERAHAIGSVNTIVNDDGRLIGDSTDGAGFLAALAQIGAGDLRGRTVVVLGAGGSARAVVYALAGDAGANVVVANRNEARARALAREFAHLEGRITTAPLAEALLRGALADAAVLVNTTSAGMHPNENETPPVPPDALGPHLIVSDLIYNPAETRLLALAKERGCRAVQNGIEMLVQQGALAFEKWTGVFPPTDVMRAAVEAALAEPKA
jgi:shikimate dehydrogenase